MAAKLLHSLADDNPDLQKQIGCMTGVFQLFDRHQIVAGRRFSGQSPKRLSLPPAGSPQFDNETAESESTHSYQRSYIVDKHSNKITQDKNRASTGSSRDSFSSMSRSSSFSSIDCNINRTNHPEPDHIMFPETPSRGSGQQTNRQSVDLRDVVKDSMYRHKPSVKDDSPDHTVNYRESLDALAKFQESNWYYNDPRELSRSKSYQFRDGNSFSGPKDCPRFSYDGRETNRLHEELPRFSLDNRENLGSTRIINTGSRNPKIDGPNGPIQSRPPSVVAKLMGLEALPDSGSTNQKELGPIRISRADLKKPDLFGPIKMHNTSRSSSREPTSPLWRNSEMKPISRFPIEPAPWKNQNGSKSPQRPVSRGVKSPTKIHGPFSSVYNEVDKRLKHLEFTQSGKDLRALKQILEAMQSMEARKEGTQNISKKQPVSTQNNTGPNHLRAFESPIVIMKPAKLVERSGEEFSIQDRKYSINNNNPKSTRRENMVNEVKPGGRHTRNAPSLTKQQPLTKDNGSTSGKNSGSISPRLPQKRVELEKRSRPPTPPADNNNNNINNKLKKPLNKQVVESSSSPGGRRRLKVQQNDLSKKINAPEEMDNRQSPIQEKSSLIMREDDPEYPSPVSVLVVDDAVYMDDSSPSPVKHMLKTLKDDTTQVLKDQWTTTNDVIPDPQSSEINRQKLQNIEHLVQKLTRLNSTHNEAQTDYIASLCENTKPDDRYISEILLASGLLLRDLTTFQFHSSGHPINPELFLVLEQTKFSNSPKQNVNINININSPEKIMKKEKFHRKLIFDTVNEILAGKLSLVVPSLEMFSRNYFRVCKKALNAQKLLRDLCVEIEELQVKKNAKDGDLEEEDDGLKTVLWEQVLIRAESWTDYDGELPVIALEVERLIFKDLVNEVVLGEAADGKRVKPGRRCRQLFSK